MKLLTNNLLNSSKELTVLGGILLNHTRAGTLRVIRKALHIISFETPWRCIVVLKVAIWSKGSHVPSYKSKEWIYWWKPWKRNLFNELNPLWNLLFSCSPSSHPWLSSSDPSPFPSMAPFVKWCPLTDSWAQHFLLYILDFRLVLQHILHVIASLD